MYGDPPRGDLTAIDRAWLRACRRYREDLMAGRVQRTAKGEFAPGPARDDFTKEPDER